jgi:hypothetical protein
MTAGLAGARDRSPCPIEVVGIQGRELASLDMPRAEYAALPTWQQTNEVAIPCDDSIGVALVRR